MLKSSNTNSLADEWIKVASPMLDKMESKTMHNHKKVTNRGNRSKTLSEVEPVQNSIKNLQSFLEISPVHMQNPPSHKLQDHAYE